MANHRTAFIVLARGASKRLPGKNLRCVGGVPLVGRAVRAARQAARRLRNPTRVIVSTDDEAIARVAREWRAEVPFMRPPELADDASRSVDACRHAIDWLADHGEEYTEVVLLQPTSPLATGEDVVHAIETFRAGDGASAVTVRPVAHTGAGLTHLLQNGRLVAPGGSTKTGAAVELNGAVYVCAPQWLRQRDRLCVAGESLAVPMPAERSIDVDTYADLALSQTLWEESLLWRLGRCFVIAEAGVNHNGCVDTALRLVDAARDGDADAVKFQSFTADRLVTRDAPKAAYQRQETPADESQFEMLKKLELSADEQRQVANHCRDQGIVYLSTPFSEDDADLLDDLDVPAIKIGSGDLTHHPLLAHVGAILRPVILSTGCSDLEEVVAAVGVLRRAGCAELAVLHCVSNYPADPADVNLRAMATLARALDVPVGYSDHTLGHEVACAAVALGARVVEKHFTLNRGMPGPDHRMSLEPDELAKFVSAIRNVEAALGDGRKRPAAGELDTRAAARRSLVGAADLPAGTVLERAHLVARRPGTGISPAELNAVLGLGLRRDLATGELLTWAHVRAGESE